MNNFEENVYETLIGVRSGNNRVPGVENAFAPGEYCDRMYLQMHEYRERLWARLGSQEDEDLEHLIMALESIQHTLCLQMFRLGRELG